MNDIEQKALALLSEVNKEMHGNPGWYEGCNRTNASPVEAVCRAIEQHEAFKQEVSDALRKWGVVEDGMELSRFIIAKPDPLVEVMEKLGWYNAPTDADELRAALEARGFEIREKNDD